MHPRMPQRNCNSMPETKFQSNDESSIHRRRDLRCNVDWSHSVPGQFITGPVDNPLVLPCTLADLSVGGCAIQIETTPISEPKIAIVRFELDDDLQMESAGRICWSRQASIGYRSYGMRFRRPLTDSILARWLERGIIDRRDKERQKVSLEVSLRRSDGENSLVDASIVDYSATGMQLEVNLPLASGERIMVTLPDGRGVMAAVVWTAIENGNCLIGCSMVNRISSTNMTNFFQANRIPQTTLDDSVLGRLRRCLRS